MYVLGDEAQLRHAMVMTGLDMDPAVRLAAALVRVEVLAAADPRRASFTRWCGPLSTPRSAATGT